jgi:ribosomal protein L11 methyltransferase
MEPTAPRRSWIEVRTTVPIAAQDLVLDWLLANGASGVQEDYPGLGLGLDGPVVSGDPGEWGGEAPRNAAAVVTLRAWVETDREAAAVASGLSTFLATLDASVPGISGSPVEASTLEPKDWSAAWKASWTPTDAGRRILVCPRWLEPPSGTDRLVVRIDPGMAFGTGTHFTTSACVALLEDALAARPADEATPVLDVGAGTGILAIAAVRLGAARALCLDVDPDAVESCRRNAAANGVADRIDVRQGTVSPSGGAFPIVLANLLSHTLIELARDLAAAVAPGGVLVVSGITDDRAADVDASLARQGLAKTAESRGEGWIASSWARPAPGR